MRAGGCSLCTGNPSRSAESQTPFGAHVNRESSWCELGALHLRVASGQVVQTSLGYFLNPLVSIFLASLFLRERLNLVQMFAVLLAGCGVAHFGWHLGQLPWIALSLALSFGLYGLLRKIVVVTPLVGLLIETAVMTPPALGVIWSLSNQGRVGFGSSAHPTLLFFGAGLVTTAVALVQQRNQTSAALHDGVSPISGADPAVARRGDSLQRSLHQPRGNILRFDLDRDRRLPRLASAIPPIP
jgi:hypothetical protein